MYRYKNIILPIIKDFYQSKYFLVDKLESKKCHFNFGVYNFKEIDLDIYNFYFLDFGVYFE